jgi:hypothetical protein
MLWLDRISVPSDTTSRELVEGLARCLYTYIPNQRLRLASSRIYLKPDVNRYAGVVTRWLF